MSKKITVNLPVAYLIAVIIALILPARAVSAHGSMKDPISSIYECYLENPETPDCLACRDAIAAGGTQPLYDWNEVNQRNAGGNHQAIIPDGQLCSAGREKYAAFDQPRTDWALTYLPFSGVYSFVYDAYVPHNQGYFEFYITKNEYDFSEPLKWSDLEFPPFATVTNPPLTNGSYIMNVALPEGKKGMHVLYVIWQRTDSPEAFYSCSNVWFGTDPTPVPTPPPRCQWPQWNSTTVYAEDDMVTYNNTSWRAKWSNSSAEPGTEGNVNPWEFNGACSPGGATSTPASTPTRTTSSTLSPLPAKGDANGDGTVTIIDALLTAQFATGITPGTFFREAADVNCSSVIDIVDALIIAQYYVGLLNTFPC